MMSNQQIRVYHTNMLAIAEHAESIADEGGPRADLLELADIRAQTLEMLGTYQAYVHRQIFTTAREDAMPERRKAAEDLKISCIRVALAYQSFVLRWPHHEAVANWTDYRRAVADMAIAVRAHVERWPEEALLQAMPAA